MKPIILRVLSPLLFITVMAMLLATAFSVNFYPVEGLLLFAGVLVAKPKNVLAAVQVENWVRYIMQRFWKDNTFLKYAYDDGPYASNGKVVHIPQPGGLPNVVANRSSLPASVTTRTDTDITYTITPYTTDPVLIPDADLHELSYSKMDSVLGDHVGAISEAVANNMLYTWATGVNGSGTAVVPILATTGGDTAKTVPPVTGQTGNRYMFGSWDFQRVKKTFDKQNAPKDGRVCVLDAEHMDQLLTSLSQGQYRDFSRYEDAKEGVVGRLFGIDILDRSSVLTTSSAGVVNAVGAALGTTDNIASLFWQKDSVCKAIGERRLFQQNDNPLYYGDIYSVLLRAAGRVRRVNAEGVAIVTQGA